jgi:hypothetical protein
MAPTVGTGSVHEFSGTTVNNREKDRFWFEFLRLILADRPFILNDAFSTWQMCITRRMFEHGVIKTIRLTA